MRYKLILLYDGSCYCGWQIQPNETSIQKILQDALTVLLQTPIKITGSGRTDAGVHALEQVAHFDSPKTIDLPKVLKSLNGILPLDIRIKTLEAVSDNFHARYGAVEKTYEYHLSTGPISNPFKQKHTLHVSYTIDPKLMKKAVEILVGKKDFKSFANDPTKGSAAKNSIRNLKEIHLIPTNDGWIFRFTADGFLYKMVRNLMGALLYVAKGKIQLSDLEKILQAHDRRAAPPPAPAKGLFLSSVKYTKSDKSDTFRR